MDIDRLEPGRELDELVAERVLGWKWGLHTFGHDLPGGPFWAIAITSVGHHVQTMPRFSTDISDAWEVVERMANYGDFSIHASRNLNAERNGWNVVMGGDYFTNALTAPHAICLAALKAVASPD